MSRNSRSRQWLHEHVNDPYVQRARSDGYRSRASFKLDEIDKRERLLIGGLRVVDLGAAPGGWSQVAAARVGRKGFVVAVDLLPMDPIPGVQFILGDIGDPAVLGAVQTALGAQRAGLVMSDMAPNLSGVRSSDEARADALAEAALETAEAVLAVKGNLLIKAFHGRGFDLLRGELRERFERVVVRKPAASRNRSAEIYLVAKGFGV